MQLSDLLEETIAKEGSDPDASGAPPTEDALPVVETTSTSTSSPPPPPPSQLEESSSSAPPTTATFPPVFNEDETPLTKSTEELTEIDREEKAGAGEGGVEGAQHAGIAMSVVEPEEGELPELEMNGEEKAGGSTAKRSLEEEETGVASEGEKLDEGAFEGSMISLRLPLKLTFVPSIPRRSPYQESPSLHSPVHDPPLLLPAQLPPKLAPSHPSALHHQPPSSPRRRNPARPPLLLRFPRQFFFFVHREGSLWMVALPGQIPRLRRLPNPRVGR